MTSRDFADPAGAARALAALERAGVPPGDVVRVEAACRGSADPDAALTALVRICAARLERHGRPPLLGDAALKRCVPLLAGSRFLAQRLTRRPRLLDWLCATRFFDRPLPVELLEADLARGLRRLAAGDEAGLRRALRLFKYRQLVRIAARDLAGVGTLPDVALEIASLAEVCIDGALRWLAADLATRHGVPQGAQGRPGSGLCVLGMGKLGAGELNFSSDVDLVFVHGEEADTSGGPAGRLPGKVFHARLAEKLVRALSEVTEDGMVFRVDLDLRPEGRAGPITLSADAMYGYYEARGRTWERAVLVKARPVGGDRELGAELLTQLQPFVWRRFLDLAAVEEIRAMKARIDREAARGAADVKLGPGGIREAEFVVVALQLLQGGRDPTLRQRGTLAGLDRLLFSGFLSARDRDTLADAWLLLRRAEHRLQMLDERQTHRLPDAQLDRERLGRSLGFEGAADFEADLARRRAEVEGIFGDLLGVSGTSPRAADPGVLLALDLEQAPDERIRALGKLGFGDPISALDGLERMARRPGSPFAPGVTGAEEDQAASLLGDAARSPDPDQALRHLAAFTSTLRNPAPYFAVLRDDSRIARLLLQLFGTSDFLSRYFLRHPELLDPLIRGETSVSRKGPARIDASSRQRVSSAPDLESRLAALRRFKNEEVLRVGLADVSGVLDLDGVQDELTTVADACLARCLELAREEVTEKHGPPPSGDISVLGLGKLGGRELGYHSDLDLVFLYADSGRESSGGTRGSLSAAEWYAKLAQRLISHLQVPLREGLLYRIDTRLRPSGSQGALVVSLHALAAYHASEGAIWERQALLKARHVAGDASLFERAMDTVIAPAVYRTDTDARAVGQALYSMRARMEGESSGERGGELNPKIGHGGLSDVEFAVQYLQLVHGAALPHIRTPSTPEAIVALREAGVLSAGDAERLADAYRFLRRLELRLRIVHDHSIAHLPRGAALTALARRLGYAGAGAGEDLALDYARVTNGLRELFRRIVGGT